MRTGQRRVAVRAVCAALLAVALTWAAWRLGTPVLMVTLCITSGMVLFALLMVAPEAIAHRRGYHWRWGRRRPGDGPFWAGTREPRRPRRPLLPARGAEAVPPDDW